MLRVFILLWLFFATDSFALTLKDCRLDHAQQEMGLAEHLFGGRPDKSPMFIRRAYVMAYDHNHHVPHWAAWHAAPEYRDTPRRTSRWSRFRTDPEFNDVNDSDYAGWFNTPGNYARGHLVPYFIAGGDRDHDGMDAEYEGTLDIEDADDACTVFEVNALSNITPQFHRRFNGESGLWYQLEAAVRTQLDHGYAYYLFAGTLFLQDKPVLRIGNRKKPESEWQIGVPHGFFKLVIDAQKEQAVAFLFDHQADLPAGCDIDQVTDPADCIVPLSTLENATGLHFFRSLPEPQQQALRNSSNRHTWQAWLQP